MSASKVDSALELVDQRSNRQITLQLLYDWGRKSLPEDKRLAEDERCAMLVLLKELRIKGGSYSWMNKLALGIGLVPTLGALGAPLWEQVFSITIRSGVLSAMAAVGGAALIVHRHYKARQTAVEMSLRELLFSNRPAGVRIQHVAEVLSEVDTGLHGDWLKRTREEDE